MSSRYSQAVAQTQEAADTPAAPPPHLTPNAAGVRTIPVTQASRASKRLHMDHVGLVVGILALGLVAGGFLVLAPTLWWIEGEAVRYLLDFAGVPAAMHPSPPPTPFWRPSTWELLGQGGPSFEVETSYPQIAGTPAAIAVIALLWLVLASGLRVPRLPLPLRVLGLLVGTLTAATVVYNAWISPIPPHPVNRVTIGWSQSGGIVAIVGAAIFALTIFPVPGPLSVKLGYLAALVVFSLLWNVLRIAVVLATAYKLGSLPFLLLEYSTGVFVQFLYIVTFYSITLFSLSARQARARPSAVADQ